jgi:crotonobetainyl-CoA:carnitine CoA-transferase CaiB-like acyl-CoA transferase
VRVGEVANPQLQAFGKPLDGIRILAIEQQQALPYATQLLARFGAEVVKVEHPDRGETGRQTLPTMLDPEGRPVGCTFLRNNLGKRSISIDLKSPRGRDLILRMAPRFDVVAENFRAGTMARFGLGYDDVAAVHPLVVYLSVSGFGNTTETPYANWSAFAPVAEAMASLYDFKRNPEDAPVSSPLGAIGDTGSAVFAAFGVLAALRHRDRIGRGQYVDVAMYDAMVAMADAGINFWSMGLSNAFLVPTINHAFRASDGFFIIMCSRAVQFRGLAKAIGRPEWLDDPALGGPVEWLAHLDDTIRPAIEGWSQTRTRHQACEELAEAGVAAGPCHSPADVVNDVHVQDRNMIVEMPRTDDVAGPILTPGNPVKLSKMAEGPESRVPWLGEHTDEVLAEELGLDAGERAALRRDGIIG